MIHFSVITCTYNAAAELPKTLSSVYAQTYPKVEHLLLDGVSKDDTLALIKAYKERSDVSENGHTVVVKSESDKGLYDAMNKGIQQATGNYLVFLNAGDVFPTANTLEQIAGSVGEGEDFPAVLYGDTDIVNAEGHFLRHRELAPPEQLSWRSFRQGMLVCHQAFYVRTDIARQTPYDLSYKFSSDVDWCIRVMKEAARRNLPLRHVHAVVVNYLEGGMTVKNHRASLKERFRVMCHHYGCVSTTMMHVWFFIRNLLRRFRK